MNGILEALITEVLVPEIAAILRRDPGKTDAEVIAELYARRERIITSGRSFLREGEAKEERSGG